MPSADNLDGVRRNDTRMETVQLQVQSGSDDSFAIVSALRQATKIKRVGVTFYQLYDNPVAQQPTLADQQFQRSGSRKRSREEVTAHPDLLQTIGALPLLEEFTCSGGMAMHTIPVSSLLALLREASQLEVLRLSRIQLQGCARDFDDLTNALGQQAALRIFALEDCTLVYNRTAPDQLKLFSPPFALDAILKALASLSSMEIIKVTTKQQFGMALVSPTQVESLCCSNSLQKLTLRGFAWNAQHITAMAPGVATSRTLKELILPKYGGVATPKVTDTLTYILQANTSLEHFEMSTLQAGGQWVQVAAKILEINTKLQVLHLGGLGDRNTNNTGLGSISVTTDDSIQFHLKLNQAGRAQLLGKTDGVVSSNREWVNAMGKLTDDLSCLYYFLSRNPSLCDVVSVHQG